MTDGNMQERLVDDYVRENRTDEAVKLLYDLIVSYAGEKDFKKAEALYEKLYEVDPMALTEIVRAGEAIEDVKSRSLDKEHREIWSELYDQLTVNEANALYYGMERVEFEAGETIITQGQISSSLYFINKGSVKVVFSRDNEDTLLTTLEAGDFFGQDHFFSATVSTVSMIANQTVKASRLESGIIGKWKTEAPALESKLFDYCQKYDKIKKAVAEKGVDRREYIRVPLPVKLGFRFYDHCGEKTKKAYKGEISDISEGGLSFFIKTSKPESVRMMLGRRLAVTFPIKFKSGESRLVEKTGQITAVQSQVFDDFSIHLRFDTPIEAHLLEAILT